MTLGPIYKKGGGGGMGDVTTAANVGDGEELFKQKNGTVLEFRTLVGVNGTTITQNGDVLEVDGGGGGGTVTDAANVGGQNEWFFQNNAGVLEFNTFEAIGGLAATLNANVWSIDGTFLLNGINDLSDALSTLAGEVAVLQEQILTATQYLIVYSAVALTNTTLNYPKIHMYVINGGIAQAVTLPVPLAADDGGSIVVKNRNTAVVSISVTGSGGLLIDGGGIVNIPTGASMTFVYSHATTEWFII